MELHQSTPATDMSFDAENPNSRAFSSPYYRGLITRSISNDTTEPNNELDIQQRSGRFFSRLRLWNEPGAQPAVFVGLCKINFPAWNLQPLRENAGALSANHADELRIDVNHEAGEDDIYEANIDIWDDNRYCTDRTDGLITYQAWKEHRDRLKRSRADDSSVEMMSETAAALGGQTIGTLVAVALTSGAASLPAVYLVEFIIVLGLICTLAGISLRRKRRAWSVLMTKIGVMATISAVIMSLAAHLPPVMMLTVGPVAFLILVAAVALA